LVSGGGIAFECRIVFFFLPEPANVPATTMPAVDASTVTVTGEKVITPSAVRSVVPAPTSEDPEGKPALHANTETAFALIVDLCFFKPKRPVTEELSSVTNTH